MTNQKTEFSNQGNLVQSVANELRTVISGGSLTVGHKLPSEAKLCKTYNVSRTVIRETIAALRTEGLIDTKKGSGTYVINTKERVTATSISIGHPENLSSTLEMLEFRAAIEIEAVAIAAVRRSPAQEEAIFECLYAMEQANITDKSSSVLDFRFHTLIAEATNNPWFRKILAMMGADAIPRARLLVNFSEQVVIDYTKQLSTEHRQIADALAAKNPLLARKTMRTHLKGGQNRYRKLLRIYQKNKTNTAK